MTTTDYRRLLGYAGDTNADACVWCNEIDAPLTVTVMGESAGDEALMCYECQNRREPCRDCGKVLDERVYPGGVCVPCRDGRRS